MTRPPFSEADVESMLAVLALTHHRLDCRGVPSAPPHMPWEQWIEQMT